MKEGDAWMEFTTQERVLVELLQRVRDEYGSLERNEGKGTDDERLKFMQGIALATNVLEMRALRRDKP